MKNNSKFYRKKIGGKIDSQNISQGLSSGAEMDSVSI